MLVLLLSTSGETNMLACYCVNCVAVCTGADVCTFDPDVWTLHASLLH